MTVTVCEFKRKEKSALERGVMINDDQLLIDQKGKPVKHRELFNYWLQPEQGCMVVP